MALVNFLVLALVTIIFYKICIVIPNASSMYVRVLVVRRWMKIRFEHNLSLDCNVHNFVVAKLHIGGGGGGGGLHQLRQVGIYLWCCTFGLSARLYCHVALIIMVSINKYEGLGLSFGMF